MYCLTEMKPRLMCGKSAALKHIKFGAVVGPQARDKDKEVQACEGQFNYSIYGTSPRYMITHPRHPDSSKISHFTAKICLISRIQATMLSKTNHYAKPLRITMDSTSTFVHMQLT